jgi:signal transduction histidine kinase
MIEESASRATRIVSDLLTFARQSNSEMRHQDLGQTVRAAVRLTDFLARRAGVEVAVELNPKRLMATYDALQIEQVLVNLIQNAIQAMPNGGKLAVSAAQTEAWIEIAVRDTGVGIQRKNLARIFDPFFTTKPEGEGTGLGLSVSYGIISQHKGRIDVESQVGKGTTFTVRLPRPRS